MARLDAREPRARDRHVASGELLLLDEHQTEALSVAWLARAVIVPADSRLRIEANHGCGQMAASGKVGLTRAGEH